MNIGQASDHAGLPAKTVRYYEDIGLITPGRDRNGYRAFNHADVHRLAFVARARALGFTIKDCRALLELYRDENRASADVKRVAQQHLAAIDAKIADLGAMRGTLAHLINACAGDNRPDCPILEDLGQDPDGAVKA